MLSDHLIVVCAMNNIILIIVTVITYQIEFPKKKGILERTSPQSPLK